VTPPVPWKRPDLFLPLPVTAGPWGVARRGKAGVALIPLPDVDEVRRRVRDNPRIHFAWTPGDRHLRPVYEIEELAADVEARAAGELREAFRKSLPSALGTLVLLVVAVLYWPKDRDTQLLVVLGIIFLGLPLWRQGIEAAFEAWRSRRRLDRDPERWRAFEATRIRFLTWVGARSYAALALIGAFVVTYLVMYRVGPEKTVEEFGLVKEKVREGEWWRLLSCAFLHGGLVHLFFNSAAGQSLARIARSIASEAQILLVFFVAALAGSVASTLLLGVTSIGASGGILGWGGMLLGMALRHRELQPTGLVSLIMRWIVLLALIGVAGMGFIDNAAHAGGLLAGLALGLWFVRNEEVALPTGRPLPIAGWVAVGAVLGAPWLWMLWVLWQGR